MRNQNLPVPSPHPCPPPPRHRSLQTAQVESVTRLECVKVGGDPAAWPLRRLLSGCTPLQLLSVGAATSAEPVLSADEAGQAGGNASQLLYLRAVIVPEAALLGEMGRLRVLDLFGCTAQQLPEHISSLTGMQHLDLSRCESLQHLPYSIGTLTGLQHLDLSGCKLLQQLPGNIVALTGLQHLNLSWCESLQQLSDSICALTGLQHLYLSRCESLQQLPDSIGALTGLQHLDLSCGSHCSSSQTALAP